MGITQNESVPAFLNEFSEALLAGFYLKDGEDFNAALARTAEAFCYGDYDLAQRIYDAAHAGWFMFASPVLSNAPLGKWNEIPVTEWASGENLSKKYWDGDTGKGMPISCLTGDSVINTYDGMKYMEDIVIGDRVLTHQGRWRPVEEVWSRESTGDLYEMVVGTRTTKIKITGSHPVKTNLGWVPVEELDATKHLIAVNGAVEFDADKSYEIDLSNVRMPNGGNSTSFSETPGLPTLIEVTPDVAWALGLWFAEGSIGRDNKGLGNGLKITMAADEQEEVLEWLEVMKANFGVSTGHSIVVDKNGNTWCNGWISGARLGRYFDKEFGKNAKLKRLPSWIIDLPKGHLHRFLGAFVDGDGHITHDGNASITISNPWLLSGLYNIALKLGHPVSMNMTRKAGKYATVRYSYSMTLKGWQLTWRVKTVSAGIPFEDGLVYCPIRSLTKLDHDETVYDIRVAEDHSFSVAGVVVHNCFSIYVPDSIVGQMEANVELAALSVAGGGVGLHNGIRAVSNKAPGPIPYMKTMDALIGYYKQGRTRRGACAFYMDVSHPDIMEHISFRVPSGGDSARKADNRTQFHNAVNVTDNFMDAVLSDSDFDLVCPHTKEIKETVKARVIWEAILETRALTGEPYLMNIDRANEALPETQKEKGLKVRGSNICSEITLPTDKDRTFVCCLSSLNLEKYEEWKDSTLVADLTRYLDNVLQYFIENAPTELAKAVYAATQERAIGIGTMGWHYYLQSKGIPFEGGGFDSGIQHTHMIFSNIKNQAVEASEKLALERGEPADMIGSGRRNSHLLALAPNSNNSIIIGTSPSIEPVSGNAYSQSTRAGTFLVKNPYLMKLLNEVATGRLGIDSKHLDEWLETQWSSIVNNGGSVFHLEFLTDKERDLFKTGFELDQHWLVEQADARQQYICQAQSLNLFFPSGVDRSYFNSVHIKAMTAPYLKTLYYARMERGVDVDVVRKIERLALIDWAGDDCVACSG